MPIPASPPSSAVRIEPDRAATRSDSSQVISRCRPIKDGPSTRCPGSGTSTAALPDRAAIAPERRRSASRPAATRRSIDRTARGGLGARLLGQVGPVRLVGAQRLGLAAAAGQRLDEQATRPVAQRVGGHEGFERRHRLGRSRPGDQQLGAVLDREAVQLVEASDLRGGPRLVAELVERLAVPQGERLLERGQPIGVVRALDEQVGEHRGVDRAGDPVAGGVGVDHVLADARPQA